MIHYASLVQQLIELGVGSCNVIMVHASMRKTGPIEGGADVLLDALFHVLGDKGTMIMVLGATEKLPFDAQTTPAHEDMGVLAERFRQRQTVTVNDHAASRYGAHGPLSSVLLEPVVQDHYHGSGSVLERFLEHKGAVLRLGADIDTVTLTHYAEYLADLPYKRLVRRRYVCADKGEQWIESLDDCEGIAHWDEGDDYFSQILIDFLGGGNVQTGQVGHCNAELFDAQTFVDFAVHWLETRLC